MGYLTLPLARYCQKFALKINGQYLFYVDFTGFMIYFAFSPPQKGDVLRPALHSSFENLFFLCMGKTV